MANLFNIMKITVDAKKLTARVLVNPGMPLYTSENIEATARVYYLAPAIAKHACFGDAGREFQDCMADTEIAHLLEHLTVEIMKETGLAEGTIAGRTRALPDDERVFEIEFTCPDDALTVGALSSAAFMMQWAFLHADQPAPDFPGTVEALRGLVLSLRGEDDDAEGGVTAEDAEDAAEAEEREREGEFDGSSESAPAGPIDTEGAYAEEHDAGPDAVFGGAAEQ